MSLSAIFSTEEQVLELFLDDMPTIERVDEIMVHVAAPPAASPFLMAAPDAWAKGLFYGNNAFTFAKALSLSELSVVSVILQATEVQENTAANASSPLASDDVLPTTERYLFFSLHVTEVSATEAFVLLSATSSSPEQVYTPGAATMATSSMSRLSACDSTPRLDWFKHAQFLQFSTFSAS